MSICVLVVRRTYGQEAAMGQSLIYQINVLSAKFSFCPNVSVLMCLCVDQASYLADSEMWVSGFHVAGPATKGPTLQRPPALLKQQTVDSPQQSGGRAGPASSLCCSFPQGGMREDPTSRMGWASIDPRRTFGFLVIPASSLPASSAAPKARPRGKTQRKRTIQAMSVYGNCVWPLLFQMGSCKQSSSL